MRHRICSGLSGRRWLSAVSNRIPAISVQWVIAYAVLIPFVTSSAYAATSDLQLWSPVTLETPLSPKTRISLEIQPRLDDTITHLALIRLRPSVTWDANKHLSLTAGYLWSPVFSEPTTFENRLWQQAQVHHPLKKSTITHQFRLDERFLDSGNSLRGRYMLRAVTPIGQTPWRWVTSNEVLVNLTQNTALPAGLNQNRTFAGVRRVLGSNRFVEAGYLLQYVHEPSTLNHVLVLRVQWMFKPGDADGVDDSPY